ncbi:MAG: hypothetical protein IRY99_10605 [Isosphaeraceae bacterium]|nr:hypothetical protein [Isosphaeraceae bacterium]
MRRWRDGISAPGWAAAMAVGLVLVGLLFGYEPVGGDPDRIYRPIKEELVHALRAGRLPFWSDRFGLGVPLVAESHVGAFYPPNLPLYGLLGVSAGYRLAMWLHNIALAIAVYGYARWLGIGPWGGAVAALAFTFCGFQAIHSSHEWAYQTLPYLPLCLLLAERYAADGRLAWAAALALAWGVQLTLGHFQVQFWTGSLALFLGFWRIIADRRPAGRIAGLVLALAWGGAIAALQLAPSWELAQVVGQTRRSFAELAFYSYPPAHWAEAAIPRLFRGLRGGAEDPYWFVQQTTGFEACFYIGTIPLILAMVGLVGAARNRALRPWLVIISASFALATMPRWWPLGYAAVLRLPGLGYFRCPARYTALTSLGLALLAGSGFDRAVSGRRFGVGLALAILLGAAAFAWAIAWSLRPEFRSSLGDEGLPARLGLAALAWGLGLGALIAWKRGRIGPLGPFFLTTLELGLLYYGGTTQWGWSVPLPASSPILKRLAREPGVGRIGGELSDLPVRAGLTTATAYLGFPLPPPNRILLLAQERGNVASADAARLLRRYGVTHLVWGSPVSVPGGEVLFVGEDEALDRLAYKPTAMTGRRLWRVLRLAAPFPPARAARRAIVVADQAALLAGLVRDDDPETAWYLASDRPPEGTSSRTRSACVWSWDGRRAVVEHDGPCDLIIARTAYPGWSARIDGGPERPMVPADGGLQSVRLEGSGISRIELRYQPTALPLAAVVSLGATATALLVLVIAKVRRGA